MNRVIHPQDRSVPVDRWNAVRRMLAAGLLLAVYGLSAGCGHTTRVIPKDEWLSVLEPLTTAQVRLNNYSATPVPGQPPISLFHVANDSAIELRSPPLTQRFDVPITRQDPYTFYVNDMRSAAPSIDALGGRAVVRIPFEDAGQELIGNCVDHVSCEFCGHPRIDLDDAQLDLEFRLRMQDERLVLWQPVARFTSTFGESGPCRDNVCAVFCDLFAPDRENQARAAIERQAVGLLESQRPILEDLLNARLRSIVGPGTRINSAVIGGRGELILLIPD